MVLIDCYSIQSHLVRLGLFVHFCSNPPSLEYSLQQQLLLYYKGSRTGSPGGQAGEVPEEGEGGAGGGEAAVPAHANLTLLTSCHCW